MTFVVLRHVRNCLCIIIIIIIIIIVCAYCSCTDICQIRLKIWPLGQSSENGQILDLPEPELKFGTALVWSNFLSRWADS